MENPVWGKIHYLEEKSKTAVTIKGKKKGTAKLQATIGTAKLACKVTVQNVSTTTNAPEGTNEQDVAALKKLIAEQRQRGATVSEIL